MWTFCIVAGAVIFTMSSIATISGGNNDSKSKK